MGTPEADLKKLVFKRDGHKCVRCGSKNQLVVHHTKYPPDSFDDMVTYCKACNTNVKIPGRISSSKNIGRPRLGSKSMTEVRVFLPHTIVRRVDKKKGILGNTRSEICRHIIINSLTKTQEGKS